VAIAVPRRSPAPKRRTPIRYVLGVAMFGVGLLMLTFAASSAAASPSPDNHGCPDGYHWERMSGVGCVQDRLPEHARYSYTSAAICNDGYVPISAPGPNAFGGDPSANYLVACLTPEEAAASAAASVPANATPVANDGGEGNDADDMLGKGPLDELAAGLAENGKNTIPPTQSDADLGGVAATGLLLMSAGGASLLTGSAGGLAGLGGGGGGGAGTGAAGPAAGPGVEHAKAASDIASAAGASSGGAAGAGGAAGGGAGGVSGFGSIFGGAGSGLPAAGGLTTTAIGGLPLPKPEMVEAGFSIFRSMKRVTSEVDPTGYGASDIAEFLGDATAVGALASILAPAAELVALATAGAAAGAEAADPRDVLEKLRRGFGQLGYMQGVLDENVGRADGKLTGLDGAPEGTAAKAAPAIPSDPTRLSDKRLHEAREAWAARADVEFDALIDAQAELADLDDRRRNLGHQIDAVNDLLAGLDEAGAIPIAPHLGETLRYGLGWYRAADPDRMVAALRESRAQARTGAKATGSIAAAPAPSPAPSPTPSAARPPAGPPSAPGVPFAQWAPANGFGASFGEAKVAVLEALAGLERWSGFFDALTGTLQVQIATLRVQADAASATRRALSSEIQHRTLEGGKR
jgi:hypothetical protein